MEYYVLKSRHFSEADGSYSKKDKGDKVTLSNSKVIKSLLSNGSISEKKPKSRYAETTKIEEV